MILKDNARRLLIFFFYDKDGIVDRYIPYMLEDMKKNVSDILFVSNGKINVKSKPVVEKVTKNILERKNVGLDVWAYKEAIESIGWDKLEEYDEVILMNYTIMGPIYPFREMFSVMNQKDLDFWGLTKFHEAPYDPFGIIECGYIPEHIQSHFIAVRNPILKSEEFKEYWESLPEINSYEESIAFHETQFTKHFEKLGFLWDVYIDSNDLEGFTYGPIMYAIVKLIKEKKCPVFKRRSFFHDYNDVLNNTAGEISYELMEYLKNYTDYDTDMIWENILRCYNMAQIKDCLQLNYVLPIAETEEVHKSNVLKNRKVALIFHAYFKDMADSTYMYVNAMPKESDVYITTDTKEKKTFFENLFQNHKFSKLEVILIENRGRDVSALLVGCKNFVMDYDYVCFAHDKKVTQLENLSVGASFAYQCLENTLGSEGYVKNIIMLFDKNPNLGIIMPPPPSHSSYFPTISDGWGPNFSGVQLLYDKLGLNVPISMDFPPVAPLGTMFWFRTKGMKKLLECDWQYKDFPKEPNKTDGSLLHAIERVYSLVVQDAGYYAAWCLTEKFAPIMITNLNFMLSGMVDGLIKNNVRRNYAETKKIVEDQCGAFESLKKANKHMQGLFTEMPNNINRGAMRIYYDIGNGFTEKASVAVKVKSNLTDFKCTMKIPSEINFIKKLRFDPEEKGNICLENLKIIMECDEGKKVPVNISKCKINGRHCKNKIIFSKNDPQIIWNVSNGNMVREVHISGNITRNVTISPLKTFIICNLDRLKNVVKNHLKGFAV